MSAQTLHDRIDAIPAGADFTDPNTYAALLYADEDAGADEPADQPPEQQAEAIEPADPPATEPVSEQAEQADEGTSASAGATDESQQQEAAGVATRDGKRIIPYKVLETERQARQDATRRAQELAEANARLQEELQARAAGTATEQTGNAAAMAAELDLSDEEIAALEDDFPQAGKLARANRILAQKLSSLERTAQQVAEQAAQQSQAASATQVQALIDDRPLLSQWQARGGMAWEAALKLDARLQADSAWAAKPMAERFDEVQRLVADEFGLAVPSAKTTPNQPAAPNPAATTQAPKPAANPTLTDLGGRSIGSDPMQGMSKGQMVDRAMGMSMEEIRRMAGLSY